jgi:hypothetical protein
MAKKRFTDAEKWQDPWFRALSPEGKVAWTYVCDTCDAAGVLLSDPERFSFEARLAVPFDQAMALLGDRVRRIDARRMLVVKFVEFQYPKGLNPKSDAQRRVIDLLEKHGLPLPGTSQVGGRGVGGTVGRQSQQEEDSDKEAEEDSEARARATPPTAPLPLAQTKPGVMELRAIPGLKITQDSLPAWLALAEQVGLKVIEAARDELVMAGKDCWQAETATVALRLHAKARRSQVDFRAQAAQQSVASERAAVLEQTRLRQAHEAIAFLNALADSGLEANADQSLLQEVRAGIASSRPGGPPIGGPFSALAKLRLWFDTSKAPTPTERTA